ncbi:hypothetical protein C8A00DRAFT_14505 [Chaetomidium leptoderma]|uniref:DUF7820 domain-containing protein n=1 Tax=Chaetomidium leptoderma TaxID=669021 RepID=A0AAN6VMJ1_9PEZI|nr:hypothetical protein C8A00DRAFT_14505 [Chaetomidium leptoderma]
MAPNDKAADLERRVSTRTSVRVSVDGGDEELELALAGMVTDGFRPAHLGGTTRPSTPSLTSASSATLFTEESPASSSRTGRPSSTAKPQIPQYILAVRQESNALTRQTTTTSTESTAYTPAESPYQGPSGPSHPYQMYQQNVRPARTLSMATSSTMPVSESSYRGPRGPSHPYGLYAQSGGIEPDAVQPAAIPLGFRGLPDQYQRRVGPDGEEIGDMIGPGGHTEQLPPYTRYPDEAYVPKATAVDGTPDAAARERATVVAPILTTPSATLPTISGAGGLGLATRNPEFESTDDLDSPRSRHSTRSFTSDDSQRRIRMDDEGVSEKRAPPKKWQAWMRRKLWGIIPYWAICLTGLVLIVMAAILGAVIGTFLAKQKRPPRKEGSWEPTFNDASPIPTPSDLSPLPTGTFALPLLPNRVSNTCFQNPSLSQAWSCHVVISGMHLTIDRDGNDYRASLDCNHSFTMLNNVYSYGEQPPLVLKPVTLDLVADKFEPSRGPAWFKMLSYNKTVILPEGWLSATGDSNSQPKRRHIASIGEGVSNLKRKGIAQPGDKPWVCNWPNTFLELFIYAQQNSSYSNWSKPISLSSSLSLSSTESTSAESTYTESKGSTTSPPYPPPTDLDESELHAEDPFPDDDDSIPPPRGEGGPYYGPTSKYSQKYFPQNLGDVAEPTTPHSSSTSSSSPTDASTTTTTGTSTNPFGPIDTGANFPPLPQPYPRVIKLEERRMSTAGAPKARCTQVEIQGRGEAARPILGHDGKPVVIDIGETGGYFGGAQQQGTAAAAAATAATGSDRNGNSKRSVDWERAMPVFPREDGGGGGGGPPDLSMCGCLWYLT